MEEYDRDSLRRLRKELAEPPQNKKGSRFISVLIILMFLIAGGFYVKTTDPAWLTGNPGYVALREKVREWTTSITSAFEKGEGENDVQETVNAALSVADEG